VGELREPGCGSLRSWVKILKELELIASVNGLAVHDVNLQSGLYKSYASGLRTLTRSNPGSFVFN
jgi:hypothetical protein